MATTCKLIAKVILGSTAADVEFTSIPGTYTDLLLVYSLRASDVSNYQTMSFNGSTSNFTQRELQGDGVSAASGSRTDSLIRASVGQDNFTSSTFGNCEIYIPNYAGSTNKSFSVTTVVENNATTGYNWAIAGLWSNTAAITSIKLAANANFTANSSAFLYGITKA